MDLEVKILIALKAQYKLASGMDWEAPASAAPVSGAAAVDQKIAEQVCTSERVKWTI